MARNNLYEHNKVPPPENIKEIPAYFNNILGGFFSRFAYIVRLVWNTGHWILFLLTFMALFRGLTPIIGALISRNLLNELQSALNNTTSGISFYDSPVFFLLIFMFVYRILTQIVNNISSALNRIAGEKVVRQVKMQIMDKSKELDIASFDDPKFYEKMENANREAGSRPLSVLSQTFGIVSTVIEFFSYLVVLFTAPGLALATVVIISISIPTAVINFVYRKKNFRYMRNRSKERRQMNYYADILVNKDMIKEVRMFDLADMFIGRYIEAFDIYYRGLRNLIFGESAWHTLIGVISGVTNLVFYILIAKRVFAGEFGIGDYSLYTGAIASVSACVSTLINTSGTIYEGTLFIDNLISFMDKEPEVVPTTASPEKVAEGSAHTIEFENVSFRYPGTKKNVLSNINFRINPGETIAVVGLNGAGKTTLIKLLMRLYDPTEGRILLDGKDIRDYELKSLYHTFGTIFQDFGKYALTAEENIRLGDIHRPTDIHEVQQAAQKSSADSYIEKLPDGYSTPLMRIFEQNGMELSIGQWQKLAIARAFYADSDILILDEPTASLDPIAEQEIFNQFDELRNDKTSIFVSHRLSSATIADRIIVLENGQIIETGNHKELMQKGEKYYELFSTQARRYISDNSENISA